MNVKESRLSTAQLESSAFILKVIAHPLRLGIVDVLRRADALTVNEICEELGSEQSLTSHHLNTMKLKGLLECQRDGKHMLYTLKMKEISKIFTCLEACHCMNVLN